MSLHSSVAIVTGGLAGIGNAIARLLSARGDFVYIFDVANEHDERVQALCAIPHIRYIQVDVSDATRVHEGFAQVIEHEKQRDKCVPALAILVNNAGITDDGLAVRMSEASWDRVLDVNLKGAFLCTQHALKFMVKQPKSYIINISSIVGMTGNSGQVNYAASKAGLIGLTKSLALEYASRNILVNAIAPGFIDTHMTASIPDVLKNEIKTRIPLKRFGSVDDIAQLVLFLTSGNADYITGQVLSVNGGLAM